VSFAGPHKVANIPDLVGDAHLVVAALEVFIMGNKIDIGHGAFRGRLDM
jgi:hypothetical protein